MRKYLFAFSAKYSVNITILALVLTMSWPNAVHAQGDGPRFYWKGMNGTNAVPVIGNSLGGNANPMDPSLNVIPGADIQAAMSLAGYARFIPVLKRSAMVSVIVPMGRITSNITAGAFSASKSARGYGDPMLQFSMNLIGPKAIMNIPQMLRYEPGFSVDVVSSLFIPIGEYDNTSPINIGQNRWYGRVGFPVVWQLGPWVPGERTTLEFLPAVWLFGNNTDFVGKTMSTKPTFQIEGHLTHDLMERLWASLDVITYQGGKATIDGVEGNALSNIGVGGTLGYKVNDNLQLTLSYSSTVNDKNPEDLKMDGFRFTLIWGWHSLVEGMHRMKGGE